MVTSHRHFDRTLEAGGKSVFEQTFKNIDDVLWKEAGCAMFHRASGSRKKRRAKWSIEIWPGPQAMIPNAIAAQVR